MKIIVLDFSDGIVKIIPNISESDDYEKILVEDFPFSLSEIEYMVVPDLEIQYLQRNK